MEHAKTVLLVCTGNSCRSIMAQGLLRKYLNDLGRDDINVISAGVHAIDGVSPTRETIEVMKQENVDVSPYRSKALTDELIKEADLILVMSGHHMDEIISRVPDAAPKVDMLRQYGLKDEERACDDLDISDPIGRPKSFYVEVLEAIKKEIKRIVKIL